jgi:hypothetical protein
MFEHHGVAAYSGLEINTMHQWIHAWQDMQPCPLAQEAIDNLAPLLPSPEAYAAQVAA